MSIEDMADKQTMAPAIPIFMFCMRCVAALTGTFCLTPSLDAEETLPWAFMNGSAEGYSVEPLAADPTPGTAICAGAEQRFWVKVSYELAVRDTGKIVLVFQTEETQLVDRGDKQQTTVTVKRGAGEVVLSEQLVVPENAKELWLYVPIVPEGYEKTSGELVMRYPIENRKRCRVEGSKVW